MNTSNIKYSTNDVKLKYLVDELNSKSLVIPDHQREFVWSKKQQKGIVETVMRGLPMPSITIRRKLLDNGTTIESLEDGQQRLTSLQRFIENEFALDKNKTQYFSTLADVIKEKIRSYKISVTYYENATDLEAIELFDNLQHGSSLTKAQRLYSIIHLSPFLQFVQQMLLTPGTGFYDRTVPFWGERDAKSNKSKDMLNATVICLTFATKDSENLTREGIDHNDIKKIKDFNKKDIEYYLEQLVSIFERVHELRPIDTKKLRTHYYDLNNYISYMVHGLILDDEKVKSGTIPFHDQQIQQWVDFMVYVRDTKDRNVLEDELHCGDKSSGGHANKARWHRGWLRMFPEVGELKDLKKNEVDSDEETV